MKEKEEIVRDWLPRYTGRGLSAFGKHRYPQRWPRWDSIIGQERFSPPTGECGSRTKCSKNSSLRHGRSASTWRRQPCSSSGLQTTPVRSTRASSFHPGSISPSRLRTTPHGSANPMPCLARHFPLRRTLGLPSGRLKKMRIASALHFEGEPNRSPAEFGPRRCEMRR